MTTASRTVVLVDPDYTALGALGAALRVRGFRVGLAVDGRTGLTRAAEMSPDVVVVDRDVEVVDLRTFLELLRDHPRTSSAFVFVTGRGDPQRLPVLDARTAALAKPFNLDEVVRRIEEAARVANGADEREHEDRQTIPGWTGDPRGAAVAVVERTRLASGEEAIALCTLLERARRPGLHGAPRIVVMAASVADAARLSAALTAIEGFSADPVGAGDLRLGPLGPLGTFRIEPGSVEVEIYALPADLALAPLWPTALQPACCAVLLEPVAEPHAVAESLRVMTTVPLVHAPAGWASPANASSAIREAIRATAPTRRV